jgi:hypothetical protein
MSEVILEVSEEFFRNRGFFITRSDNLLLIRGRKTSNQPAQFLLQEPEVHLIANAVVKVVGWHTCKITTKVLSQFPEILQFVRQENLARIARHFHDEPFAKILILPQLPASRDLREKTIVRLKESSIDHVLLLPDVLTAVIKDIEPRHVYSSQVCELLRTLKFYRLVSIPRTEQMELPLKAKHGPA